MQVAWTHIPGPLDPRPAIHAARRRRRAVLHRLVQPHLRARRRHRQADLVVPAGTRRRAVSRQTHSPYTRGLALGEGKAFVGTVDGRLFGLDAKTGKLLWETKLIDSEKLTVGFTGAPLYAKGMVIIGAQGGEWPYRGPIFGVDAATGQKKWEFDTAGGTDEAKKTWGNDTWRVGGGGGWMPGTYDSATNTIWWGTANPDPLYDWSGARLQDHRRPPWRQSLYHLRHRARSSIPAS